MRVVWTLRRRLGVVFAAFALLTGVTAVAGATVLAERSAATQQLQGRVEPARTLLTELQVAMIDQETGQRGYVITGDPSFLVPYDQGIEDADALLAELATLLTAGPQSAASLREVESALQAWREQAAEPEIAATRAGGAGAAADLVASGEAASCSTASVPAARRSAPGC